MNVVLLKKLRNRFKRMRHPKHFRMDQVAIKTDCGAAMCFIGHTLELSGYKLKLKKDRDLKCDNPSRCDYYFVSAAGYVLQNPYVAAMKNLDMDSNQASALFEDFSINTVRKAIKKLDRLIAKAESNQ